MVFIPFGLQSKVKDPPFLVAIIVVVTAFMSIAKFSKLDEYRTEYVHGEERQKYFFELRSLYVNACDAFQDEKTCDYLIKFKQDDVIRNPYVANKDAERYLINANTLDKNLYSDWHSSAAMLKRLTEKQKTEELNALRILAFNSQEQVIEYQKKYGLLSQGNLGPLTLIEAQFTHSDWFHLLGNLAFFLFFGACLEQAMGRWWLLRIYFLGGSLGLLAQVFAVSSSTLFIVGASANIFACAGAFLRLYWKQPLHVLFSFFFVMNKPIKLPTWSFFVFFVLIQQLTGLTSGEGTSVAYLAHMVGLAIGFGLAHLWMMQKKFVPSKYLIFPYESEMLARVEARSGCKDKLNTLVDLLFYAPNNIEAYRRFHKVAKSCSCETPCMSAGSQKFYGQQISNMVKELLLDKKIEASAQIYFMSQELECDTETVIQHLTADDIMLLGNCFYKQKKIAVLEKLFQAAVETFPQEHKQVFAQFLDSLTREKGEQGHAS